MGKSLFGVALKTLTTPVLKFIFNGERFFLSPSLLSSFFFITAKLTLASKQDVHNRLKSVYFLIENKNSNGQMLFMGLFIYIQEYFQHKDSWFIETS